MRVFITGGTGLIGQRLVLDRLERGDRVVILSRSRARAARRFAADANPNVEVVEGNPATPGDWQQRVSGCDAVVHLAGAGISDRRWTREYKLEIAESRIDSTYQVVEAIERAAQRPQVFISGSAVGFYGECGSEAIDETRQPGDDFLATLAVQWEAQAIRAEKLGVRVVRLRTGVVLDARDGALPLMARPFRFFMGGPIGLGRPFMSWIHWRDLIGIMHHALRDRRLSGAVNGTAPNPVTNRQFSAALGRALGRPSWLPVPPIAVRLVMGEVAKYITMSQRAMPKKAMAAGYAFLFPTIDEALENLFARREHEASDAVMAMASAQAHSPGSPRGVTVHLAAAPASVSAGSDSAGQVPSQGDAHKPVRPSRPVRMLALSVDGALMRSDGTMAPGDVQAVRAAERAGCAVILATSRPPRAVRSILQTLGTSGPAITLGGALIWNHLDNLVLHHQGIEPALAQEIISAIRIAQPQCPVVLEVQDAWWTDEADPEAMWLPWRVRDADGVLDPLAARHEPVTRISLGGNDAAVAAVMPVLREQFWKPRRIALYQLETGVVQLTDPRVDKAVALQRVALRLGLSREDVMVIGDSRIDSGMIEWAGFSVALANAPAHVQSLACAVVPSNDETGVARAIQRYVLSGR